jgi:hypothetical protein
MNGVIGQVEDIYSVEEGSSVIGNMWEGVSKVEEEMGRFRKVLDLGGQGRRVGGPSGGELDRDAVCEEVMYKCDSF